MGKRWDRWRRRADKALAIALIIDEIQGTDWSKIQQELAAAPAARQLLGALRRLREATKR